MASTAPPSAVRLLHTGDWHTGRSIRGRSRLEEFAAVFDEVISIARDARVDAALVAGDVYDGAVPSPDAEELVLDTFLRFRDASIPVVLIAGNHDSPSRLGAWSRVLGAVGVVAVPRVAPPGAGTLVELAGKDGGEAALVACVPFVPERRFGQAAALFAGGEDWYQDYAEGMGKMLVEMAKGFRSDRVNVLMAHLFTHGAMIGGGEREATIGIEYAVSPARLPGDASYVALGHVHRPQSVRGAPSPTRYAGSLLQLDFGETGHGKSVTLVEATPGKPAKVSEVSLSAGRRLIDVRGTLDELEARARSVGDAYLRVFVRTDGPVPGMADRVRERLPNALAVHLEYERKDAAPAGPPISSLQPKDQFVRYYRDTHGTEPDPGLLAAFEEVLSMEEEKV